LAYQLSEPFARELAKIVRFFRRRGFALDGFENPTLDSEAGVLVYNDSGEVIPAFAAMRVTASLNEDGRTFYKVNKPDATTEWRLDYLINGPYEIEIGGYGCAQKGNHVRALGDGSTRNYGFVWSPTASSWEFKPNPFGNLMCAGSDDIADDVLIGKIIQSERNFIAKSTSSITARSGTTVGSGTAKLRYLSGTTLTDWANNAASVHSFTVYNNQATAVVTDAEIQIMIEGCSGKAIITNGPCA